jgi:penicillin-binding protein 1A
MKTVYAGGEGEIVEKKSRFIATVRPVSSEEEAVAFINEMKKKYWDARHNCSAFVIGDRQEISRCSDDGEPAQTAGRPMLDVLLKEEIHNVCVVVTRYFGKDVSELTLSECAVLAAITQNPSRFNPISNPEKNAERRMKVLNNMLDQEFISQSEYDEAVADNVYDRIQLVNVELQDNGINSYFIDELTDQVIRDLVEQKGYTETQAYKTLYQSGLTIYSTQDMDIQNIADEEVNNQDNYTSSPKVSFSYRVSIRSTDGSVKNYSEQTMLSYYKNKDNPNFKSTNYSINFASEEDADAAIEQYKADIMQEGDEIVDGSETVIYTLQPQASLTVIDQSTGEVKAIVGGRGDKTASKTLNRATDTTRQPGSTFKILASYSAALDAGGLTLASVQDDAPYTYAGANGKSVSNYDKRYRGFTTLREAITDSINIVTVKTLAQVGVSLGWQYVQEYGFTTVDSRDMNEALALGGITQGVSNLELTAAYAAIANQGTYIKPKFYTKILDHDGNVLIDNTTPESHTVIKDTTAWLLTSAMEDVMTSGTGTSAYFGSSMAQAGKSGTTTSSRDALFAGYTPYYTCAVWGGYDDNAMQKGSDTNYPKRIWKAVMKRIHENLAYKDFTKPSGIVAVAVCKESGKLPIEGVCDHDPRGNCVITEYFAQGTEPTEYCDHHTVANICTASNMLAGSYCPAETVTTGVYVIGGSETTEDAPYLLTDAFLSQTCTVHNEFNSTYTGTNSFPGSTGVNPIGADPAGDAATPDASTTTTDPNTTTDPAATTDQSVDGQ